MSHQREVQELDRGLTFEAAVAAMREPDAALAPLSQRAVDSIAMATKFTGVTAAAELMPTTMEWARSEIASRIQPAASPGLVSRISASRAALAGIGLVE